MVGILPPIFHAVSHKSFPKVTFLPISIYCSPFNSEMELNVTLVPQDLNLELISRELNTLSLFMQLELYVRGKYWDMNSSILFVMVLIIKFSLIV